MLLVDHTLISKGLELISVVPTFALYVIHLIL